MSLIAAILVFGLIILFHEFGHFLMAKRGGIGVVEFSLGMGPRLFSVVKGGTRYSLKAFPFGGSCMMLGEDLDLEEDTEQDGDKWASGSRESAKDAQSREASGSRESRLDRKNAVRQENQPGRENTVRQAHPECRGTFFNDTPAWTRFLVIAGGPLFNFILAFLGACFIISAVGYEPTDVYSVTKGYPAEAAGIRAGDVITHINGKRMHNYGDILNYISFHPGRTLTIAFRRGQEKQTAVIEPKFSEEYGRYLVGLSYGGRRRSESLFTTAKYGYYELCYWVDTTFESLKMIVRRQVGANDIAGPVRIVSMLDNTVKESREFGLMAVLLNLTNMCVLLSVNLGVMNLLPIPALDGGRLVFILLEALRGRPVDREKEGMIHMAGMAVLMVLMVLILFNDIRNML